VNIELPHSSGYKTIARQKTKENILRPMGFISSLIKEFGGRNFAKSQITQMMVGTMGEDDRTIMTLSDAMYKKYGLKRVYYSSYFPVQETNVLPQNRTPHWRRNRLYQADRLVALYGMSPDELVPENTPFLSQDIDPKAAWALRNLGMFPIEVNTADYEMLLRVPGIGITGAKRIVAARKICALTPEHLRKMRVSLKYGIYFMTFKGRYYGGISPDSEWLRTKLVSAPIKPQQLELKTENG
jgi:predicted DNA-binding helix-hairpin-helix protein